MISWFATWSAVLISRYKVHAAGRTSHAWITGHRCDQPIAGFAKHIHFKFTTNKNHQDKMNTEWSTGFFISINGRTTESLVATQEDFFSCATIRRLPDDVAYDPACIDIVKVTYREYVLEGAKSTPGVGRFGGDPVKNVDTEPITAPMIPRRARLKPEDFQ